MRNDPGARARECASRIPKNGTLLEIGVWRGDNARRILKLHPTARLTLVDPWRVAEGSYATSGSSDSKCSQETFDRHYRETIAKLAPYNDRVAIVRASSEEAFIRVVDHFDVIFIDGDHSFLGCRNDIERWRGRAKRYLGGHDYGKSSFPGVSQAVDMLCSDAVMGADSTWWLKMGAPA